MDHLELRAKLAEIDINDFTGLHNLYEMSRRFSAVYLKDLDVSETVRRVEYKFAHALRAAQARGEVTSRTNLTAGVPVRQFLGNGGRSKIIYMHMRLDEQQFEAALKLAREKHGSLNQDSFLAAVSELNAGAELKPVILKAVPTRRGERHVNNLAMTASSLAQACRAIPVGEVDGPALRDLIQQAQEDLGIIRGFLKRVNTDG